MDDKQQAEDADNSEAKKSLLKRFVGLLQYTPTLISLAFLLFFIANASNQYKFTLIHNIENYFYDLRVQLSMPSTVDPRVVIVDIDEKSLDIIGRWPWHRNYLAEMTNQLFDHYQVSALGFDSVFAEPDENSALKMLSDLPTQLDLQPEELEQLEELKYEWQTDDQFAGAMIARNVVLGFVFKEYIAEGEVATLGVIPEPSIVESALDGVEVDFYKAEGYTGNLETFQFATPYGGFFNYPSDAGFVRKAPMLQFYQGNIYESLALSLFRVAHGNPPIRLVFSDPEQLDSLTLEGVKVGDYFIPTDGRASVFVPFRGRQGSFPYVSAADVLAGTADPKVLENAIVLLGTTAPGLLDTRATPVGTTYAGVEVHANVISGILDQSFKSKPVYIAGVHYVLLAFNALLLIVLMPRLAPLLALSVSICLLLTNILLNLWLWHRVDLIVPIANILLLISLITFVELNYGYFVVSRDKRRLAGMFGYYVPADIVKEMDGQEAELSLAGEDREMTVLFSDVRSFTTISEGLEPTELTRMMNAFLTPITRAIHDARGTIDKYIGDAVMAFWGAPLVDEKHALNAVLAAIKMIEETDNLKSPFAKQGWPEIKLGIGISSGNMRVGNMGSEFRMAYTVLGDTVNLGARLEGLTKMYGVKIIVSEKTAEMTPEIHYRELDRVVVKGKNEAVTLFEPIGLAKDISTEQEKLTERLVVALAAYRNQEWGVATDLFEALKGSLPDVLCELYLGRIEAFQINPPDSDWQGVDFLTSK